MYKIEKTSEWHYSIVKFWEDWKEIKRFWNVKNSIEALWEAESSLALENYNFDKPIEYLEKLAFEKSIKLFLHGVQYYYL